LLNDYVPDVALNNSNKGLPRLRTHGKLKDKGGVNQPGVPQSGLPINMSLNNLLVNLRDDSA